MIRKSDIAVATDTKTLVRTIQDKPRLMEFVACKTVGEYNRNKEKIKKFYLDEQLTKDSEKNNKRTPNGISRTQQQMVNSQGRMPAQRQIRNEHKGSQTQRAPQKGQTNKEGQQSKNHII